MARVPRLVVRDRLLLVLLVLFVVLVVWAWPGWRGLVLAARPGVLVSLAGLMVAGRAVLDSGAPEWLVGRILGLGAPAWHVLFMVSVASGVLAAFYTNDASLFVSVPAVLLLVESSGSCIDASLAVSLVVAGANLGSSLTPVGNPQNILVAGDYGVGLAEFLGAMAPLVAAGYLVVALVSWLLAPECRVEAGLPAPRVEWRLLAAGLAGLAGVVWGLESGRLLAGGVIGLLLASIVYPGSLRGLSPQLLLVLGLFIVDFDLLGSMLPIAASASQSPVETYAYALILSQLAGNVPATAMLAGETPYWRALALGANAGGLIALWSSLANIIGLRLANNRVSPWRMQAYLLAIGIPTALAGALLASIPWPPR